MNAEKLQLVQRNETALRVLKFLANRERISDETTLEGFRSFLGRNGYHLNRDEFLGLFRDLETAGAGKLIDHAGKPEGKFIWHYSLKEVSEQILNPNRLMEIRPLHEPFEPVVKIVPKKRRGRPTGYSPKPKVKDKPVAETLALAPELLLVFTTESGEVIPFKFKDAEKLAEQVRVIKQKLG